MKEWEAIGTRKIIDSPPWTQVRNDLTGRYQHARITNDSNQQEVMKTMMMKLLVNRTAEEEEVLQQFLTAELENRDSEQPTKDEC